MIETVINFDDIGQRAKLYVTLRGLRGAHRVEITRYRKRRSDAQNGYYWAVPVKYFATFLREQGQPCTEDEAHEIMKMKFLRVDKINTRTGELIGEAVRSTASLTTEEFAVYIDQCIAWLADMFHIVCPDPSEYQP